MHRDGQHESESGECQGAASYETALPNEGALPLLHHPASDKDHAAEVSRERPVRFAAAVLQREEPEENEHRRGHPPEEAQFRASFRRRSMLPHGAEPGHEPEPDQDAELGAEVRQRAPPANAAIVIEPGMNLCVLQRDPIVRSVPQQNRHAAQRANPGHHPEADAAQMTTQGRRRQQEQPEARHEQDHRVLGQHAEHQADAGA